MAARATYLADTSAWHRAKYVPDKWRALLRENEIATCVVVELEWLYSARSGADYRKHLLARSSLGIAPLTQEIAESGLRIQSLLANASEGGHRSVRPADCLIAAIAQSAGLTVLHYDQDFDRIAAVTGQPTEWLAERGSLPH